MSLKLAFTAFVVVQFLDLILTHIGLSMGFQEGNPIAAWLMQLIGVTAGLLVVKGICLIGGVILYRHANITLLWSLVFWVVAVAVIPWVILILWVKP